MYDYALHQTHTSFVTGNKANATSLRNNFDDKQNVVLNETANFAVKHSSSQNTDDAEIDVSLSKVASASYPLPGVGGTMVDYIINPHEFKYLISESAACHDKPDVLIYVHSKASDFIGRRRIRETWAQVRSYRNVTFKTLFMLGRYANLAHQSEIERESQKYHDVVQEDFLDHYRNLTYKNIMGLKWNKYYCADAKMTIKVDTDVIVNMFKLVEFYRHYTRITNALQNVIYCSVFRHYRPRRDKGDKWYVTFDEYAHEYYPDHCEGFAYILSPDVIGTLYNTSLYTPYYWIDDVYVTGFLANNAHVRLKSFSYSAGFGSVTVNNLRWNYTEHVHRNIFVLFKYLKSTQLWHDTWTAMKDAHAST